VRVPPKEEEGQGMRAKPIKSDVIEAFMKFDNGFTEVRLKLYILDILRIMEICKTAGNLYYYNELRWFIDQIVRTDPRMGIIDFNRKLPRIKLKEKKPWELEQMSQKA
jgi:hypothetical protein